MWNRVLLLPSICGRLVAFAARAARLRPNTGLRAAAALRGLGWLGRVRVPRDRRGLAVAMFSIGGIAAIGMVVLGTEAGLWYLTKRRAQNAADAAAYAGAVRMVYAQWMLGLTISGGQAQAADAATDTATQNGFSGGTASGIATTVTINVPPVSPSPYTSHQGAVQVIIQQTRQRLISGLFLSSDPVIVVAATATAFQTVDVCLLALTNGISMSGGAALNPTNETCARVGRLAQHSGAIRHDRQRARPISRLSQPI